MKTINFLNYKHLNQIHARTDKALKGAFMNWEFLFLHGESLEITLTVLLNKLNSENGHMHYALYLVQCT